MKEKATKNKTMLRKAIRLFLCLALLAALLPASVAKATVTKASVIDTSKKGSITIHKYEYNGTTVTPAPTPVAGNGQEGQTIPEGAVALQGAGFTIYKVKNANELENYYNTNPTALPSAEEFYESVGGKYQPKSGVTATGTEVTTDSNGKAEFTNLELGIYLVIETTVPDKVTTSITPFLVSVPMTTSEGDDWLYNVHVYPKNKTTYGGVKLKKTGDANAALAGVKFVLQKKKSNASYETVTKDDKGQSIGTDGVLTTASDGTITVQDLSPGDYRFIETSIGTNYGYILDGAKAYTFTIGTDGTVTYTNSTPTIVPSGSSDTYISAVNYKPDVEKKVLNSNNEEKKETDYSVGDTVTYKITVKVPSNVEKLRTFQVKDTPNKIKYTAGTLKVYQANGTTEIGSSTYTLSENPTGNTDGFSILFHTGADGGIKANAGNNIIITYKAVVQDNAVTTKEGNSNTVTLTYENKILPANQDDGNPNPTKNPTPAPADQYEIEDSATVYTFKMSILKTGESDAKLSGVKFDLYKEDTNGAVTGDAAKVLGLDSNKKWTKLETLTTDNNGTVSTAKGLANGIYYLVETETNDGYNLLSKPIKVQLKAEYTTSFKEKVVGETKTVKNEINAASNTLTEKMSVDDAADQSSLTVNVKNSKGFTLPTTGGAGGFLFTLVGCVIMIMGIVIFHKTKKRQVEN